ncbi:TetR/AcrR family transcriptional regulator [Kribbella sandramycini]|uniref:TetR/AcrR family transcriptional regulator n=2 Tax=Kribbella sandramycini TaxID=60450 RepID=A0A7Y4P1Z9_9ACTN|nr:TetR/AcrR family transcriptional regulator [Kribbella sandramycini]
MMAKTVRTDRVNATRELILVTAERMFAERGIHEVSNRQISEAAGQGNNTAVGYHFGTKADLIRAILRRHSGAVEERRQELVAALPPDADLRAWVEVLVRPTTDYLATLGVPSWMARFTAQLATDPALRDVMFEEMLGSPTMLRVIDALSESMGAQPPAVRMERGAMARILIVQMNADFERALAENQLTARSTWHDMATGLIDGIVAIWSAPFTTP